MIKKVSFLLIAVFASCLFTIVAYAFNTYNHQPFTLVRVGDLAEANANMSGTVSVKADIVDVKGPTNLAFILCYEGFGGLKYVGRADFTTSSPESRISTWRNMKSHVYHGRIILGSNPSNSAIHGEIYIGKA